jgi:hypothetical protein
MEREQPRTIQVPLKQMYLTNPESALVTLRAQGTLGENATCSVETHRARDKLLELTERYCVVFQTIANGAKIQMLLQEPSASGNESRVLECLSA